MTIAVASNIGSLSDSETVKVLNGIRLTDVHDTGTWADIRTAVG